MPDVTIIICSHNRADDLEQTLASIARARVPEGWNVTLTVVDNRSTDRTAEVVRACRPPSMRVEYAYEPGPSKSYALNHALRISDSDVLLFTDDDVRVPVGWIEGMCEPILRGEADAVAGGVVLAPHLQRPWMEPWNTGILAETRGLDPVSPRRLVGANMAIAAPVVDAVGEFDTDLGPGVTGFGEDSLYSSRLREAGFVIGGRLDVAVEHHLDESRLSRSAYIESLDRLGQTQAHMRYRRKTNTFSRIYSVLFEMGSLAKNYVRLAALRMARGGAQPSPEGLPRWEFDLLLTVYRSLHYLRLQYARVATGGVRG